MKTGYNDNDNSEHYTSTTISKAGKRCTLIKKKKGGRQKLNTYY